MHDDNQTITLEQRELNINKLVIFLIIIHKFYEI